MKRFFIALIAAILSIGAFAGELGLNLEKFFDGRFDSNPKVELSKIKRNGEINYYLDFNNDPQIIKEVMDALHKDMKGEEFDTEIITKSETYYKTTIVRNGYTIDIGLQIPKKGRCNLYIRSKRIKNDKNNKNTSYIITSDNPQSTITINM